MDEPFGALDALTREQMNLEMLRIWRESGKTIIFVTHSIQEAVFLASHCAVLTAGPARMAKYFPIELPFPRPCRSRPPTNSAPMRGEFMRALGLVWVTSVQAARGRRSSIAVASLANTYPPRRSFAP